MNPGRSLEATKGGKARVPGFTCRQWALIVAGSLALIAATRWPLVPLRHLYHIDNVNFALALDHFNPAMDQPQPPGDPMYVALTRALRRFGPRPEVVFPLSGVLGSAAALAALCWTGEMLFGATAGLLAALLLALNPVFWLAGVGNYVRVYLALGAATVAGLVWRSLHSATRSAMYFCLAAGALGLFAGFRPEMGVLLAPLLFVTAWRRRAPASQWLAATACMAATVLPWLLITAYQAGGLAALYRLNSHYLAAQSRHTSWLYGASLAEGLRMAAASVYWNLLGALPWVPLVPFAWPRLRATLADARTGDSEAAGFLALWWTPPFLFYTLVHIHNPDHALVAIPVACLAGAWVLTRLPKTWLAWAAAAVLAGTAVLFFYPTRSPFWASNYRIAQFTMQSAEQIYHRAGELSRRGPLTVLWHDGYITSREIGYYYPRVPILNLEDGSAELQLDNRTGPAARQGEDVTIQAGEVLWIDPAPASEEGFFTGLRRALHGAMGSEGAMHWGELPAGTRFQAGGVWIRAVSEPAKSSGPGAR